jgi:hypothetical protein
MSACPVCGTDSVPESEVTSSLLAVCDVLVYKALETIGKWIVRADRSRFAALGQRPFYLAHTLWQPDDAICSKALKGAWDVVPAMLDQHGCCGITSKAVVTMLDGYVHDLVITGTPHSMNHLVYRFETYLHLPVPVRVSVHA